jgi:hypothetical protein
VTGTIALMLSKNSTLTPAAIRACLSQSATLPPGVAKGDAEWGDGVLNARGAVDCVPLPGPVP